ncbi:MAG: ATP-binding protein [Oligoflexales bacterium]
MHNFDLKKIFVVNYVILILFVLYVFYSFPLRQEIEDRVTNLKLQVAPYLDDVSEVVVVAIDQKSISKIESPGVSDITYRGLTKIVDAALAKEAKLVIPLLHTQVFNPQAPERKIFLEHFSNKSKVIMGLFDIKEHGGFLTNEKNPQLGTAGVGYSFRTQQVRDIPFVNKKEPIPTLLYQVANAIQPEIIAPLQKTLPKNENGHLVFPIHYFPNSRITTVSAQEVLTSRTLGQTLKNKIVLIGYTDFRPFVGRVTEPTFVNTPLHNSPDETRYGSPLVYVHAIAIENLLDNSWLRSSPFWIVALQAATAILVVYALWRFGTVVAVLGFVVFALGWFGFEALFVGIMNLNLSYADFIAFSFISTLTGALRTLEQDAKQRLQEESEQQTRKDLMNLQSYFLDKFAYALSDVNQSILGTLMQHEAVLTELNRDVYDKLRFSSLELEDYLTSIKKVSQISSPRAIKVNFQPCLVSGAIKKTMARHANKVAERSQTIDLDVSQDATIMTDEVLLMQILDNLLSNAIKYSPLKSMIKIKTWVGAKYVTIRIIDQGPGLKPGEEKRIFEKFYRIKDDQVYQIKGHGLGLYLSRYFAGLINSAVDVEPHSGIGATFFVRIPKK